MTGQRKGDQGYASVRPWYWPWRFRIVWAAWRLLVRFRYWRTGDCGNSCDGVVPEAECPIHDAAVSAAVMERIEKGKGEGK